MSIQCHSDGRWTITNDATGETKVLDASMPRGQKEAEAAAWHPVPVPVTVSRLQLLVALSSAGLLDQVKAAVAQAGGTVQIVWDNANAFDRSSAMLNQMAAGLGLSSSSVDDLFRVAGAISF